jgi:hypothetical protein
MGCSTFPPSLAIGGNWPRFLLLCFSVVQRFSGVSQLAGGTRLLIGTCTCVPACTAPNTSLGERLTPGGVLFCSPWSKPFDTFGLQCPGDPVAPHGGSARRAHQQNEFIAETQQPHVKWRLRGYGALSQKNNVPDVRPASATAARPSRAHPG